MKRLIVPLAVAGLLSLPVALAATALDADELEHKAESAQTAEDHEAIAQHYQEEAKKARETAERHRRMGSVWSKRQVGTPSKSLSSNLAKTMPSHCEKVADNYEAAAAQLDEMAAAHREAAKAAQQ